MYQTVLKNVSKITSATVTGRERGTSVQCYECTRAEPAAVSWCARS